MASRSDPAIHKSTVQAGNKDTDGAAARALEQVAVVLADIAAAVVRKEKTRGHQNRRQSV